jgi:hypothetical protein
VDAAKSLAEQYKVTDRTIRNDALFTSALDTLGRSLGVDFETVKPENLEKSLFKEYKIIWFTGCARL